LVEINTTEAVIGVVTTILGGGIGAALLTWLLNRRRTRTEVVPAEGTGLDDLLSKVKSLMTEKLEDFTKLQDLSVRIEAQRVLIEVRDQEIDRQGDMIKEILVEQGRAEERERQCQTKLSQVMEKLDEYGDLHVINRRLVQDNLRMQGELDEHSKQSSSVQ
jgi:hypothetical protein